jgi:hypothetical protein
MNDARMQMLERISEDESLVGDLEGDQATQLRQWAATTAEAIAQREDLDDHAVAAQLNAIRAAARITAANGGDITQAPANLAQVLRASDRTMAIRTTPLRPIQPPPPPSLWHRFMSFWRKENK